MERKERTYTTTNTVVEWEAIDGTLFRDEKQCKEYEKTATAVLGERIKNISITCGPACSLLPNGCEETVYVLRPESDRDIETIFQLMKLYNAEYPLAEMKKDLMGKLTMVMVGECGDWASVYNLEYYMSKWTEATPKPEEKEEK